MLVQMLKQIVTFALLNCKQIKHKTANDIFGATKHEDYQYLQDDVKTNKKPDLDPNVLVSFVI